MADKGVLILGEVVDGKVVPITYELLGIGKKLATDLGEELSAVLVGSGVAGAANDVIAHGAAKVYVVDDPLLKDYQTASYAAVVEKVVKQASPNILVMGQTSIGRDLAPRLAFRLGTGLAMDCVNLSIDPASKLMVAVRPVYGGNAQAAFVTEKARPQMATVRVKSQEPLAADASRKGEVVKIPAGLTPDVLKVKVVQKVKEEVVGVKLEDAPVVVCGGRGLGGPEPFKELEALAKLFGGAVGATRPPCDSGWVPSSIQVGLTGKIVSPGLYIAVALSGSSQHLAGCSGSKVIVAINKDGEANIFKVAQFGVVGDYKKVLPVFTQKLKELLAK